MPPDTTSDPSQCDFVYFDAHSDILNSVIEEQTTGRTTVIATDFLSDMQSSNIGTRVMAVFVEDTYLPEQAIRRALDMIAAFYRELQNTDELNLVTNRTDLHDRNPNTLNLILGLEGAEPIQDDVSLLEIFYHLGLRILTLTHTRRNAVADGCFYVDKPTGRLGGITDFGITVLDRAQELGIVIDVSQLNTPGFWDVVDHTDDPFIASHSNCDALHSHPRNLTDDQLDAIAAANGVVGIASVSEFVSPGTPTLDEFLDHVDHAVDVAGVNHVGFGFDFFEYLIPYRDGWDPTDPPFGGTVTGIRNDADVNALGPALRDRGYSTEEILQLTHQNFTRVFDTVLPD